jgi:hypothetical protein
MAPDPDLALRLDMARVFTALRPEQRQLVWLAYVEGASHKEIGMAHDALVREWATLQQWINQDREALLMEMGGELVSEFEMKTLHVVDTAGTPERWRRVGVFPLPERRISRKKAAS